MINNDPDIFVGKDLTDNICAIRGQTLHALTLKGLFILALPSGHPGTIPQGILALHIPGLITSTHRRKRNLYINSI
jgi:hypothetical protein